MEVLKMLSANQIAEFLKQLYLKKHKVNQLDILYLDRVQGMLQGSI